MTVGRLLIAVDNCIISVADGDDDGGTVDTWDWWWRRSVEGSECLVVEV